MPKQSFLSTDFFIAASENEVAQALLLVPERQPQITLLKENRLLHSMRFLYEQKVKPVQHYVDVSIFPLNETYMHISLHGSYTNGKPVHTDPDISLALRQFESALCAIMQREESPSDRIRKNIDQALKKPTPLINALKLLFSGKQVRL